MTAASLKQQLVEVSQDYLGPAAPRFIDRQISTHIKKNANDITKDDIKNLIEWIKLSFALVTSNKQLIDEYVGRLNLIVQDREGTS